MATIGTDPLIKWDKFLFDPEHLPVLKFEKKTSKAKEGKEGNDYYTGPVQYIEDFETKDGEKKKRIITRVKIDCPILKCLNGLKVTEMEGGRKQASMMIPFDMSDPEIAAFVGQELPNGIGEYKKAWDSANNARAAIANLEEGDKTGMEKYTAMIDTAETTMAQAGFLTRFWYEGIMRAWEYKSDIGCKVSRIDGMEGAATRTVYRKTPASPPSKFFQVFLVGNPDTIRSQKAPFILPSLEKKEGESVDWKYLYNSSFAVKPVLHVKSVYYGGGKASVQMEFSSATICSEIIPISTSGEQPEYVESLRAQTEFVNKIADSFKSLKLRMGTVNEGEIPKPSKTENSTDNEKPEPETETKPKATMSSILSKTASKEAPKKMAVPAKKVNTTLE